MRSAPIGVADMRQKALELYEETWENYHRVNDRRDEIADRELQRMQWRAQNGNKAAKALLKDPAAFQRHVDFVCSNDDKWCMLVGQQQFSERLTNFQTNATRTEYELMMIGHR